MFNKIIREISGQIELIDEARNNNDVATCLSLFSQIYDLIGYVIERSVNNYRLGNRSRLLLLAYAMLILSELSENKLMVLERATRECYRLWGAMNSDFQFYNTSKEDMALHFFHDIFAYDNGYREPALKKVRKDEFNEKTIQAINHELHHATVLSYPRSTVLAPDFSYIGQCVGKMVAEMSISYTYINKFIQVANSRYQPQQNIAMFRTISSIHQYNRGDFSKFTQSKETNRVRAIMDAEDEQCEAWFRAAELFRITGYYPPLPAEWEIWLTRRPLVDSLRTVYLGTMIKEVQNILAILKKFEGLMHEVMEVHFSSERANYLRKKGYIKADKLENFLIFIIKKLNLNHRTTLGKVIDLLYDDICNPRSAYHLLRAVRSPMVTALKAVLASMNNPIVAHDDITDDQFNGRKLAEIGRILKDITVLSKSHMVSPEPSLAMEDVLKRSPIIQGVPVNEPFNRIRKIHPVKPSSRRLENSRVSAHLASIRHQQRLVVSDHDSSAISLPPAVHQESVSLASRGLKAIVTSSVVAALKVAWQGVKMAFNAMIQCIPFLCVALSKSSTTISKNNLPTVKHVLPETHQSERLPQQVVADFSTTKVQKELALPSKTATPSRSITPSVSRSVTMRVSVGHKLVQALHSQKGKLEEAVSHLSEKNYEEASVSKEKYHDHIQSAENVILPTTLTPV